MKPLKVSSARTAQVQNEQFIVHFSLLEQTFWTSAVLPLETSIEILTVNFLSQGANDSINMQTDNSIDKLMFLSEKAFHYLAAANSRDLRIAGLLLDGVATIKEMNQ